MIGISLTVNFTRLSFGDVVTWQILILIVCKTLSIMKTTLKDDVSCHCKIPLCGGGLVLSTLVPYRSWESQQPPRLVGGIALSVSTVLIDTQLKYLGKPMPVSGMKHKLKYWILNFGLRGSFGNWAIELPGFYSEELPICWRRDLQYVEFCVPGHQTTFFSDPTAPVAVDRFKDDTYLKTMSWLPGAHLLRQVILLGHLTIVECFVYVNNNLSSCINTCLSPLLSLGLGCDEACSSNPGT